MLRVSRVGEQWWTWNEHNSKNIFIGLTGRGSGCRWVYHSDIEFDCHHCIFWPHKWLQSSRCHRVRNLRQMVFLSVDWRLQRRWWRLMSFSPYYDPWLNLTVSSRFIYLFGRCSFVREPNSRSVLLACVILYIEDWSTRFNFFESRQRVPYS